MPHKQQLARHTQHPLITAPLSHATTLHSSANSRERRSHSPPPPRYKPGGYSYHEGDAFDPRMTQAASKRGVLLTSRSRPLASADLAAFDYIIGMDATNQRDIATAVQFWIGVGAAGDGVDAQQVGWWAGS